jgi:fibronectin type 3 domain-containing protein
MAHYVSTDSSSRGPRTRLGLCLFALAVAVATWTSPTASREDIVVTFAAFGDFGKAGSGELSVANLVKSWNPDFIAVLGDNNYEYGAASTIDANIGQYYHSFIHPYVGNYGPGASVNRFFPALGNHDWGDGYIWPAHVQPHYDYFTLPGNERYYEYTWGPVHMFAIDSDYHEPDGTSATSVQAAWLQDRLAASTAPWKIVYFHHPSYTSGARPASENMRWPLREWGATAVLMAHHHHYERILVANTPHFISGLGGHGFGDLSFPTAGSQFRYRSNYGALRVTATTQQLQFEFVTIAGTVMDTYTIAAAAGEGAPSNLVATPAPVGRVDLYWTDHSDLETEFRIERSNDGVSFGEVATVGANVTTYTDTNVSVDPTPYYYRVRALAGEPTAYSNVAAATTVPMPPGPLSVTGEAVNTTSVRVSWADVAGSAGTNVYREVMGDFVYIGTVGAGTTQFVDVERQPATTYNYLARAFNSGGESPSSNTVTVTLGQLAVPTNLVATGVSTSQIALSWTDNSAEHYFKVLRSTNGTSFSVVAWVPANGTTYTDGGRAAGTTYYYRVQAYETGGGLSPLSEIASAATLTSNTPPPAASNLSAQAASPSQINLAWTDNSANESGFRIERAIGSGSFSLLASVGANVTAYADTGLTQNTTYSYRVMSFNGTGIAAPTNTASATTPLSNVAAPTNLSGVATGARTVNLTWQDNASNEAGFKVYRSTDNVNYTLMGSTGVNVTTYTNGSAEPATTYHYRVVAYLGSGSSLPSNTATVTTPPVPSAPTGLSAKALSSSQVLLNWTDTSNNETHFRIDRSPNGVSFTTVAWVGTNITTYTDGGRSANTTYHYRVSSYNANGSSAPSNVVTITTP